MVEELAYRGEELYTDKEVEMAFKSFDNDRNGILTRAEFKAVMTSFGDCPLSADKFEDVFHHIDKDDGGTISFDEFMEWTNEVQREVISKQARKDFEEDDFEDDDLYAQEFANRHSF